MNTHSKNLLSFILLLFLYLLSACAPYKNADDENLFFKGQDDSGVTVILNTPPQRIVSLNLSTDEMLLAIVPHNRIAGLSWYIEDRGLSSMTDEAMDVPIKLKDRDPEHILALHPDLVLTTDGVDAELTKSLRDLGLTVYVTNTPLNIDGILQRISTIGRLTDCEAVAQKLDDHLQTRLKDIQAHIGDIPEKDQPIVAAFSPSGVFGRKGGLFEDMLHHAGARNAAGMAGLTVDHPVSLEEIIAINPDVFLLPTWGAKNENVQAFRENLLKNPALQTVRAIREKRIYTISDVYRYSASQNAIEGVYQIAKALYPTRFTKTN